MPDNGPFRSRRLPEKSNPFERPAWQAEAACRGSDPDVFFPTRSRDTTAPKEICRGCPVREECLAYALEHRELHGVWGGKSERERRRIRRGDPQPRGRYITLTPDDPRHGTNNGYQNGACRCELCRDAYSKYLRDLKERKQAG